MVLSVNNPSNTLYQTLNQIQYSGVVRVTANGLAGTGTLLENGKAILTAAHLFANGISNTKVTFDLATGMRKTIDAERVVIHSLYDAENVNNDVALIWLSQSAPIDAVRSSLYRSSDEIGKVITLVGYGLIGTGVSGSIESDGSYPLRLKAENRIDNDINAISSAVGNLLAWHPLNNSQLVADFDNGTASQDALGLLTNTANLGQGVLEGIIAPGDSGGPAFIASQIAGIASYGASISKQGIHPDIDDVTNSSYGEIAAWQRVSYYQQWIDQTIREQYLNVPTRAQDVQKTVIEGNSDVVYAYFLLEFNGVRSDPNQILSVDFATRDGSALAGKDYLPTSGTLKLYPNEQQAVIPVEVLGDLLVEEDETFFLDVFNPIGGSFGDGVVKLTAMRTIVDDDYLF